MYSLMNPATHATEVFKYICKLRWLCVSSVHRDPCVTDSKVEYIRISKQILT